MNIGTAPQPRTAPCDGDQFDELWHIVSWKEHYRARMTMRVPRALCGVLLVGDPDRPDPGPSSPWCAVCVDLNRERSA